jgi:hypothetical protein
MGVVISVQAVLLGCRLMAAVPYGLLAIVYPTVMLLSQIMLVCGVSGVLHELGSARRLAKSGEGFEREP